MVWHFIGVYIINRTLHDRLEIRNFSSRVEKYFTRSLRSLVKYFSTLEEKFRFSARPCNILYLFSAKSWYQPWSIMKNKGLRQKGNSFHLGSESGVTLTLSGHLVTHSCHIISLQISWTDAVSVTMFWSCSTLIVPRKRKPLRLFCLVIWC